MLSCWLLKTLYEKNLCKVYDLLLFNKDYTSLTLTLLFSEPATTGTLIPLKTANRILSIYILLASITHTNTHELLKLWWLLIGVSVWWQSGQKPAFWNILTCSNWTLSAVRLELNISYTKPRIKYWTTHTISLFLKNP